MEQQANEQITPQLNTTPVTITLPTYQLTNLLQVIQQLPFNIAAPLLQAIVSQLPQPQEAETQVKQENN